MNTAIQLQPSNPFGPLSTCTQRRSRDADRRIGSAGGRVGGAAADDLEKIFDDRSGNFGPRVAIRGVAGVILRSFTHRRTNDA